jgi:hypothetical protein
MPTAYMTEGRVTLSGVSFTGTEGDPGSVLNWTGLSGSNDANVEIFDRDDDGLLDANTTLPTNGDYYFGDANPFTGYTITVGGVEYGVFLIGSAYSVPLPVDGSTQAIIPNSGSSNPWQLEASTFLCFAPDTAIATPTGEVAVETLAIGDPILTHDGRTVPVKWIGRQTVLTRFHMAERLQPVRVRAGALGEGLPERDLVLTADLALLIGGLLINAGALVNGGSIDWVPLSELGERFTVYHVETEEHDIILAEGAPAETFIDYVGRQAFDNYAEYVALYGEERIITEMPYPRISTARLVPPALKARMGKVAAA